MIFNEELKPDTPITTITHFVHTGADVPVQKEQVQLRYRYSCVVNHARHDDIAATICQEVHGNQQHSSEIRHHSDWRGE